MKQVYVTAHGSLKRGYAGKTPNVWWSPRWALKRCHNDRYCVSNHRRLHLLLNRLSRRWWKRTSKLRVTGFCERNSPVTGEFPAQRASNAENVSISWRHHGPKIFWSLLTLDMTPTKSGTYFREKCSLNGDVIFAESWKKLKLSTDKLKLDFKLLRKIFSDATITTNKSTSEIDANLAQNVM